MRFIVLLGVKTCPLVCSWRWSVLDSFYSSWITFSLREFWSMDCYTGLGPRWFEIKKKKKTHLLDIPIIFQGITPHVHIGLHRLNVDWELTIFYWVPSIFPLLQQYYLLGLGAIFHALAGIWFVLNRFSLYYKNTLKSVVHKHFPNLCLHLM